MPARALWLATTVLGLAVHGAGGAVAFGAAAFDPAFLVIALLAVAGLGCATALATVR